MTSLWRRVLVIVLMCLYCGADGISNSKSHSLLTNEERRGVDLENEIITKQRDQMASEAKQKRGLCCNGPNRYPERYPENSHGGGIDYPPTGIDGGRYSHSRPEASGPGLGAYGPAGPSGHSPAYNGVRPHYPASAHGYYDGPSGYGSSYEHPPPYAPPYEEEYHVQHNEGHGGGGAMGNYKSLALKKLLLPLAGLAIIGVAASISHNPVLLQLGTLKGRKRRSAVFKKVYPMNPKVRRVQTNR